MTLLVLPKYVFLPILSEWLLLIDIGVLDTALCNYSLRSIFLMHINAKTMCFKLKCEDCVVPVMTKSFVAWINLRDVSLDYIDISNELRQFDVVPFLLKNSQIVKRITTRRCDSVLSIQLIEFLNVCCSNIKSFTVVQSVSNDLYQQISTTLTAFHICHCCRVNVDSIVHVIRVCKALISVSISHCQIIDEASFITGGSSPALESLELVNCVSKLDKCKIASRLIDSCDKLKRIVVSGGRNDEECLHPSEQSRWQKLTFVDWSDSFLLMNSSLRLFISDCSLLTSLNLKNCCRIRDTSLMVIAAKCPKLQSLTVGLSTRYKNEHPFCHISNVGLLEVLNSCRDMSHWCVYDCSATVDLVRSIITQCSGRLKSLLLYSELISMNDECLADLVEHCQASLTALALNDLDHISNESLSHLTSSCTLLVELTLLNNRPTSAYSTPIVSLANNCTRLVKLHIVEDLVNHDGNVSRSCYYLLATQCRLLEDLSIANSYEINDLSIIQFTSYCPYVTSLCLLNCWNVVGDCLQEVCKVYGRRLATLSLVNNNKVQGFSDAMLMNTLPIWSRHITLLDLSHNLNVTSKCITRVLRHCGDRLTSLNLSYCTSLTSACSTSIALYCAHLSYLFLDYCPNVSDESIFHILQRCTLLLKLSLKGRVGGHAAVDGGGVTVAGGVMSLFWLSDLHSLYPDVVVT